MNVEYNLTNESLKKALDENVYWQLYARPPAKKISKLKLTRAVQRWKKEESKDDLYVPSLRVIGTEDEIRRWMTTKGYPLDQVEAALDEAFGAENIDDPEFKDLTTRKPPITSNQALSALRLFNTSIKVDATMISVVKLHNAAHEEKTSPMKRMVKKNTVIHEAEDEVAAASSSGPTISKTQLKKKLESRISKLKDGYVLDISTMQSNGNGIKVIQRPLSNDRVRHGISDLPVVSSSESVFENLLEILGMVDRKGEWATTRMLNNARTPPRQPVVTSKSIRE